MSNAIILVLAADVAGFDKLVKSVKDTWGSIKVDKCYELYYYGYRVNYPRPEPNKVIRIGDDLICGLDENIPNINVKTLLAFKHIYEAYDFDYVFRCCAGSYVNKHNLTKFLLNKPKNNFYCGIAGTLGNVSFASGSGYFISKDLIKLLLDNPSSFTCHPCDDVAIGWFLTSKGIKIYPGAARQDIDIPGSVRIADNGSQRTVLTNVNDPNAVPLPPLDRNQYHYHFRHNVTIMHAIHQVLNAHH